MSISSLKSSLAVRGHRAARVLSGWIRRAPGAQRALGMPAGRIRSLKDWVERRRRSQHWWYRFREPWYTQGRDQLVWHKPHLPRGFGQEPVGTLKEVLPYHVFDPLFVASIPRGRVLAPDGLVFTPDGLLIEESTWGGPWLEEVYGALLRLPAPKRRDGSIFPITSPGRGGYAHWLLEELPRLMLLPHVEDSDVGVLVHAGLADWQRSVLNDLGLENSRICELEPGLSQWEMVHVPSHLGRPGHPHPDGCRWLRERLSPGAATSTGKRLYITRENARRRRVRNEAELLGLLADHGFEVVALERLPFRRQVELISGAEWIVAPHGAGLANLVFAPAGCRVVELFAPTCVRWMYYHLSAVNGLPYAYVIGSQAYEVDANDRDSGCHDMRIELGPLREALRFLEAGSAGTRAKMESAEHAL